MSYAPFNPRNNMASYFKQIKPPMQVLQKGGAIREFYKPIGIVPERLHRFELQIGSGIGVSGRKKKKVSF
jgi:hypothetical protein